MPLYAYRCTECGHRFEKIQSFSAEPEQECPKCHGKLERPLTAPRLHFKGAGWYVNDYAGKSAPSAAESAADSAAGAAPAASSESTGSAPATPAAAAAAAAPASPASASPAAASTPSTAS